MYSEEEQRAIFIASWDAVENFYRQTQDFGWKWISPRMLPTICAFRAPGWDAIFYVKDISFSQLELLRGTGPFVPTRHVRLGISFSRWRVPRMILTFEGPSIRVRWMQKITMSPKLDRILQLMAAYPIHFPDD